MVDLRAFVVIDSLQPQFAAFLATVAQGFLPRTGQASLFVEIAPGMEINRVTDIALKSTRVTPGMQIVERHFGMLEVHADSQADVRQAGAAILEALELTEDQRLRPRVVSDQVVRHLDDHQCMLINRMRHGNMIMAGQTLFILECEPAAYAALAANEAEKAAPIRLVGLGNNGAVGRLRLAGTDAHIEAAVAAVHRALAGVRGRTNQGID